jgi:hypothetical protein
VRDYLSGLRSAARARRVEPVNVGTGSLSGVIVVARLRALGDLASLADVSTTRQSSWRGLRARCRAALDVGQFMAGEHNKRRW